MTNKNRLIRNLNTTANSQAVRTTGQYASKGIHKTAKWLTTDHAGTSLSVMMMEFQQNMNYSTASLNLCTRRTNRLNQTLNPLQSTVAWLADYLRYAWDILLGFIGPIISMIFWSIFRVVVIVLCNVIFFYVLFSLLFS